MKFRVGQVLKIEGQYYYREEECIVTVTRIDADASPDEYPIEVLSNTGAWYEHFTEDGFLWRGEYDVFLRPLTKLDRLLLGLE